MNICWRRDRFTLALLFAFGVCLFPAMAMARLNGSDFVGDSLTSMQSIDAGWENIFQDTFTNESNNSVWFLSRSIAQLVLTLAGCVFIYRVAIELAKGTAWQTFIAPTAALLFCFYLLGGNASPGLRLVNDALHVKNYFRNGLMEQSLAGIKFNEAIKDVMLQDASKSLLQRQIAQCDSLVAPPVFLPSVDRPTDSTVRLTKEQDILYQKKECYQKVYDYATELEAQVEQNCNGLCSLTGHFIADVKDAVKTGIDNEYKKLTTKDGGIFNPIGPAFSVGDMLLGGAFFNIVKTIMHILQYVFINGLQGAYYLSILSFMPAVAWGLVPFTSGSSLNTWIRGLLMVILSEFYYILLISASALIMSKLQTTKFSDIITAVVFGLGAPTAAFYLARWNTAGAIAGMSTGFGQIAQAVPLVGGLAAGFTRFRGAKK